MTRKPPKLPFHGAVLAALPARPAGSAPAKPMVWSDVRACMEAALRGVPHQVIDLGADGLLVHTLDEATATAAQREIERAAERLTATLPILRLFRLPDDRDDLHRELAHPESIGKPDKHGPDRLRLEEIMRGRDIDAYRADAPIWTLGGNENDILGYSVRIDIDRLAADLSIGSAASERRRADLEQLASERVINAYAHGRPGHRHRQFIRLPSSLLAMETLWATLAEKGTKARDNLVVEIDVRAPDCPAVVARLSRLGFATCVSGVDWSARPLPDVHGATWIAGAVGANAAANPLSAAVQRIGARRAIAVVDAEPASLERAVTAGFRYAVGPAADAATAARPA